MFNVQKQWEKIQVAARIIASIPDPSTIIVILINSRLFLEDYMDKEQYINSLNTLKV